MSYDHIPLYAGYVSTEVETRRKSKMEEKKLSDIIPYIDKEQRALPQKSEVCLFSTVYRKMATISKSCSHSQSSFLFSD